MSRIFINNNYTVLNGFENLKEEVYVIERLGGVQFTSEKPDTLCPVYKYSLVDREGERVIADTELAERLRSRGFGNGEGFIYLDGRYTCNNLQ